MKADIMPTQLLLTGATGRLGKLVAAELNQQGIAWRAFARRASAANALGASEVVQGDFHKPADVDQAVESMRTVILIAGDAPDQDVQEINLVNAAVKAGVQHIVKLYRRQRVLEKNIFWSKKPLSKAVCSGLLSGLYSFSNRSYSLPIRSKKITKLFCLRVKVLRHLWMQGMWRSAW
jgi:NAD(P)H-binding